MSDVVPVPRSVAVAMLQALSGARARARADGHSGLSPELAAVLQVLETILRPDPVAAVARGGSAEGGCEDPRIGVEAVALRTGSRPTSVRRAAARGTLVGRKVGGAWEFTVDAVERWEKTLAVVLARRKAPDVEVGLVDVEAAMRAELDAVEASLREAEERLRASELERDATGPLLALATARNDVVSVWKLQARHAAALKDVAELQPTLGPLRERRGELVSYLAPLDARRAEAVRLRAALVAEDVEAELLAECDALATKLDRLHELGADARGEWAMAGYFRRIAEAIRCTGSFSRAGLEMKLSNREARRAKVARLDAGEAE